jgi:hypothetical protein
MNRTEALAWCVKHIESRIKSIIEAMGRYSAVNKPIPQEWIDELSSLNQSECK